MVVRSEAYAAAATRPSKHSRHVIGVVESIIETFVAAVIAHADTAASS